MNQKHKFQHGDLARVIRPNTGAPPANRFYIDDLVFVGERNRDEERVKATHGARWAWLYEQDLAPAVVEGKQRLPLNIARVLASEAKTLLAPACERIEVAGSIRRGKPDVGDIELVCVPRVAVIRDMFGGDAGIGANALDALCTQLLEDQALAYRFDKRGVRAWGSRYKRALFCARGVTFALDIFAVLPPAQWGVIYTLRTGPGDFSKRLVTARQQGGAMPSHMRVKDGVLRSGNGKTVSTPEEAHFFAALGLPYIPPAERTVKRLETEARWALEVGR